MISPIGGLTAGVTATVPSGGVSVVTAPQAQDCLSCAPLRSLLTQCGTCGGTTTTASCGPGETPPPCTATQVVDPQTGCCISTVPTPAFCPAGDVPAPCPSGYSIDPAHPGCCELTTTIGIQPVCPPGDTPAPCGPGYTTDPAHPGCCEISSIIVTQGGCPTGDVPVGAGGFCPPGYASDPLYPGCCAPSTTITTQNQCQPGETLPPCTAGQTIDPITGCCITTPVVKYQCPPGDVAVGPGNLCPQGYISDPATFGACCLPSLTTTGQGCASGENPQPCAPGQAIDPATNCCYTPTPVKTGQQCPTGEYVQPCRTGDVIDPASSCCYTPTTITSQGCPPGCASCPAGCCAGGTTPTPIGGQPQPLPTPIPPPVTAIEACFVCPGGEPDYRNALSGQPNGCYLASIFALQAGQALPPPESYTPGMFAGAGAL